MPPPWKNIQANVVDNLVVHGLDLLDTSDSDSDTEPAPLPPLFRIANLQELVMQDLDGSFDDFEPYDGDQEMEVDEIAGFEAEGPEFEVFDPFDDEDPFPPFDGVDEPQQRIPPPVYADRCELEDIENARDEDDEAADELMGILFLALAEQIAEMRGPYTQIQKSEDWFEVSMRWPPTWFQNTYRVSSCSFWRIATLLQENPIFQSKGRRPQRPVPVQLACFLLRYGRYGSTAFDANANLSLGEGTVFLYCKRVTRALREVGLECVAWPDEA
ncbi:hypothetical protein FRC06_008232 [Ceratobasidium sp. 370]|nr:hypothetical protein FRC06_008232 [Ceratobasidium sp. 370]